MQREMGNPDRKLIPKIIESGFETFNPVLNSGGISLILCGLYFLMLLQCFDYAI
jgi:hypothetical protein